MQKSENLEMDRSIKEQIGKLYGYLSGFFACWIIDIGLRLNLFEVINDCRNGISAKELTERLRLDFYLVDMWCKAAYSFELLDLDEKGYFHFANFMNLLLLNRSSYSVAGAIEIFVGASESFFHFCEIFKTGKPLNLKDMGRFYHNSIEKATVIIPNYIISHVLPNDPYLKNLVDKEVKILDFGCGAGLGMIEYAKVFNNWNFLGVDIDQTIIHKAEEYIKHNRLESRIKVKVITSGNLNIDQDFDLILLFFTLHEIKNREATLRDLFKVLKKDGDLIIIEFPRLEDIVESRTPSGRMVMGEQITESLLGNTLISVNEMRELLRITNYRNVREYEGIVFRVYIAQR